MIERLLAALVRGLTLLVAGGSVESMVGEIDGKQRVYIANHSSHLDFVLVWSSLPVEVRLLTRPVAARDYWGRGVPRYIAERVFKAVLIDRLPHEDAKDGALLGREAVTKMLEGMGERFSLILFPEGTRSLDGRVNPFRSGLYHLCRARPELEVMPVCLTNLNRILPKGEVLPVPMLSRVTFGEPITLGAGEDKTEFLERARLALERLQTR